MSNLFDMGGYELYVWGSFGCALAVLAWNGWAPVAARRKLMQEQDVEEDESEDAA